MSIKYIAGTAGIPTLAVSADAVAPVPRARLIVRALVLGLWCLVLSVTAACGRTGEGGPEAAKSAPRTSPAGEQPGPAVIVVPQDSPQFKQLRIEPVRTQAFATDEVVAPGRVTINPNRVSRVLPPVQGRVLKVMAKLGDSVEQGQPLVTLDSPDADAAISGYLQAEATERQAQVALAKAEADLQRTTDLFEHQAVAAKDVLTAQNDLAQARTTRENARATREQTLRKLELLGLKPSDFRQPVVIRAPISGTITDINVTPGEYRAAVSYSSDTTAPLMSVADLSTVWMSSDVPEPFIRFIHIGDHVDITLVAYPGEVFTGRVARVASTLDAQTRTLKVHVDLPNPRGLFVPEMFGTIRHVGATRILTVVPSAAVIQEYGRTVVFVERAPGEFERRAVATGVRAGDLVAVLSGLDANTRVVVDGAILLKGQ